VSSPIASAAAHERRARGRYLGPVVHPGMRFATRCLSFAAQLVLSMLPIACSTSSHCSYSPSPIPGVTIHAPCDLTFTAVTASGACQQVVGGPPSAPLFFEGTGSGGTCNITVTLSNGFHTTLSVQFTAGTGACDTDLTPSTDTLVIDAGASTPECGATAPADASGG
jgi:hypothetical protein